MFLLQVQVPYEKLLIDNSRDRKSAVLPSHQRCIFLAQSECAACSILQWTGMSRKVVRSLSLALVNNQVIWRFLATNSDKLNAGGQLSPFPRSNVFKFAHFEC